MCQSRPVAGPIVEKYRLPQREERVMSTFHTRTCVAEDSQRTQEHEQVNNVRRVNLVTQTSVYSEGRTASAKASSVRCLQIVVHHVLLLPCTAHIKCSHHLLWYYINQLKVCFSPPTTAVMRSGGQNYLLVEQLVIVFPGVPFLQNLTCRAPTCFRARFRDRPPLPHYFLLHLHYQQSDLLLPDRNDPGR